MVKLKNVLEDQTVRNINGIFTQQLYIKSITACNTTIT